jgi:uncharacterized phosphosugar-binding protein
MMNENQIFDIARQYINHARYNQSMNIELASEIIINSLKKGGILIAFGSGHSIAGALELVNRRGGLIPARLLIEPSFGKYEVIEGYGSRLMEEVDLRENDVFFIISNSGINPLIVEIAEKVKSKGVKLIALTSLKGSKELRSNHSSGKKLYEFADVVIDNNVPALDVCISIEGIEADVVGISSIANSVLLQPVIIRVIQVLKEDGFGHLVYDVSSNSEETQLQQQKTFVLYKDRLLRNDNAIIG